VINDLELYNFRNYTSVRIQFGQNLNVFIGNNGQGKTNLVEAICLLLTGEFLRSKKLTDVIQYAKKEASIFGSLEGKNSTTNTSRVTLTEKIKTHYFDEKKVSSHFIRNQQSLILFTPDSLSAIKSGPEARRELVDELVKDIFPQTNRYYIQYKKILATRNKILKNFKEDKSSLQETKFLLQSIDKQFLKHASFLTQIRIKALNQIQPFFKNAAQSLFSKDYNPFLKYSMSGVEVNHVDVDEIHRKLIIRSQELTNAELSIGTTLVGPHKHEIDIIFDGFSARNYCSQGQQRTLILAFKMAQIVYHKQISKIQPTLILDDVLSELDEGRGQDLVRFLQETPTQVFMTTTQIKQLEGKQFQNIKVFEVEAGTIRER
jgi:DNA replication and repair protein RecF